MGQLILLRHGQSQWNLENRFTGWTDVDLTDEGRAQAWRAGEDLAKAGIAPTLCFTSVLKRAIRTLWICLDATDRMWVQVTRDWRLNERHYGALQGLNKAETAEKHGDEQVHIWRRSYDIAPPGLDADDPRGPWNDPRYQAIPRDKLPRVETLKTTTERLMPLWGGPIASALRSGEVVLVAAHGNSLRAIVKDLDDIPDDVIPHVEIPTGIPLVYELNEHLRPLDSRYLGDAAAEHETPAEVRRRAAGGG